MTVRMVLAKACHHSSGPFPPSLHERRVARLDAYDALRGQKTTRTAGARPGVLQDPAPGAGGGHSHDVRGCVRALLSGRRRSRRHCSQGSPGSRLAGAKGARKREEEAMVIQKERTRGRDRDESCRSCFWRWSPCQFLAAPRRRCASALGHSDQG